ncbi:MAG: methylmalonyl Co-A mutase-associated GTPase MeaB, partial [Nitrospiraceae bacterium]
MIKKSTDIVTLVDRVKAGDIRALSRLITLVENQEPEGKAALEHLAPRT